MSNVATVDRPIGPSITAAMAERYSMAPAAFEQTLRATIIPKDCTKEQLAAFLVVAHEYGLNPILKEIYAFPAKGGGIQPVVSIDGWVKLMNSHPMMDGIEFDDHLDDKKQLTAISAKVHRKDRAHPIVVTEYMAECRRATDPWKQWPHRMLRHKALIQAARYAFGYSNIFDPDEAERMGADVSGMRDVSPPPAPPPAPRVIAATRDPDPEILGVEEDEAQEPAGTPETVPEPSGLDGPGNVPPPAPAPPGGVPALTAADKKTLKAFAAECASQNTPEALRRVVGRFWSANDLGDGDDRPLARAAGEISGAHLKRTTGESSPADADQVVRKVLQG